MLRMSLRKIRGSIQFYPENWINMKTTNCYAYALGLDIKEEDICQYAYQPGIISLNRSLFCTKKSLDRYIDDCSYENFMMGLERDLNCLNIKYREVLPTDKLKEDEWKIALLVQIYNNKLFDFHFLREREDGRWFQKNGYYGKICDRDCLGNPIFNPVDSEWDYFRYDKCYALKIKK